LKDEVEALRDENQKLQRSLKQVNSGQSGGDIQHVIAPKKEVKFQGSQEPDQNAALAESRAVEKINGLLQKKTMELEIVGKALKKQDNDHRR
jgi:hypothetical protein